MTVISFSKIEAAKFLLYCIGQSISDGVRWLSRNWLDMLALTVSGWLVIGGSALMVWLIFTRY